jgi:hypothetical protein
MIVIIPFVIFILVVAWMLRPGKSPTGARKAAIAAAVIPPVLAAIAAIVFQLAHNAAGETSVSGSSNTLVVVSEGLVCAAIAAAVALAFKHKGEAARGAGFGGCIGIIILIIELGLLEWLGGV